MLRRNKDGAPADFARPEPGSRARRTSADLARSFKWRFYSLLDFGTLRLAAWYKAVFLRGVTFIGVTGSCGKTTAKELIFLILSSAKPGCKNHGNENVPLQVARTLLRVRPWHRFCVQEVGISHEFPIQSTLDLLKPRIGVVTNIGNDHLGAFGTKDAIAAEKGKLISVLPAGGASILNADDGRVAALKAVSSAQVITYGSAEDAILRAEDVRCNWPERLSFTAIYQGQAQTVRTRLCGAHLLSSVLAALSAGLAMGIPLARCVAAIEEAPPFSGRMSPVEGANGVTFIRDDWKAPLWTVPPALDFMRRARAARKIVVVGTLSDYQGDAARKYIQVAEQALEAADHVFFVGRWSSRCLRVKRRSAEQSLRAFADVEDLIEHLRRFLRRGDLVLLKGRAPIDHLARVVDDLSDAPLPGPEAEPATHSSGPPRMPGSGDGSRVPDGAGADPSNRTARAIVGLGNAAEEFRHTRHNVGHRVLDEIAAAHARHWAREADASVAVLESPSDVVYLIKTLTPVNGTGPALLGILTQLGIEPAACLLVYDDLDLAPGKIRVRMQGGPGGHNGVRSILHAFQTEAFPRVRIGIGRPEHKAQTTTYVLQEFSAAERPGMDSACRLAAERALELSRSL